MRNIFSYIFVGVSILLFILNSFDIFIRINLIKDPIFLFAFILIVFFINIKTLYTYFQNLYYGKEYFKIFLFIILSLFTLLIIPGISYFKNSKTKFLLSTFNEWVCFIGFLITFINIVSSLIIKKDISLDKDCSITNNKISAEFNSFKIIDTPFFGNGKKLRKNGNTLEVANWLENNTGDNLWILMNEWYSSHKNEYKNYPIINAKENNWKGNKEWVNQLNAFAKDSQNEFVEENYSVEKIDINILKKSLKNNHAFLFVLKKAWEKVNDREFCLYYRYETKDGIGFYIKNKIEEKVKNHYWIGYVDSDNESKIWLWCKEEDSYPESLNIDGINNKTSDEQIKFFSNWIRKTVIPYIKSEEKEGENL